MSTDIPDYTCENVRVLPAAHHIRERPGMYIGDTRATGLHSLACELVYNAINEFLAGHASRMDVTLHPDGSLSVADDGRGIPVSVHPDEGRPFLELAFTRVLVTGKFAFTPYQNHCGLHGVGAKAVAALSAWTVADVRRGGRAYRQRFECGYAVTEVEDLGPADGSGTTVRFLPDPTIFTQTRFDFDTLADRLRELAFLHPGLTITLADERDGRREDFRFPHGTADFVRWLNHDATPWHEPIVVRVTDGDLRIDAALQWTGDDERIRGYANGAYNVAGGTHVAGLRAGVTRAVRPCAAESAAFANLEVTGADIAEGLTAVVSVRLPNPQFEAATKVSLYNREVQAPIARAVADAVSRFLRDHPAVAGRLFARALAAGAARRHRRTERAAHHKKPRRR